MIHFDLKCCDGHRFDGWFRSSADFEAQVERNLVACTVCGTSSVEKALMRPALGSSPSSERSGSDVENVQDKTPVKKLTAMEPAREKTVADMKELWSALQNSARRLRNESDYVGARFAEEARRVHYGETSARGIYGEADRDDVEALHEEGILVMPLPPLPEDQN